MRDPITVDDVLSSRLICWPFNLLDCCLVTDAGGAVVLVEPGAGPGPAKTSRSGCWGSARRTTTR